MMIGIGEIFAGIVAIVLATSPTPDKTTAHLEKTQRGAFRPHGHRSILFWMDIFISQERSGEIKIRQLPEC